MTEVDVFIEISKGSNVKYEYDKDKKMLVCDRILHTPLNYPFNYGFIPNTLSEDNDPIDVVVLMDDVLLPGSVIKCKIIGYLDTSDCNGNDPKLIACPIEKVDPSWIKTNCIYMSCFNIDKHMLNKIKYFFQHYKDLENKNVRVGEFYGKEYAIDIYNDSINRFQFKLLQKKKITDYFERS
jgi:inorganic pyrophosphatase